MKVETGIETGLFSNKLSKAKKETVISWDLLIYLSAIANNNLTADIRSSICRDLTLYLTLICLLPLMNLGRQSRASNTALRACLSRSASQTYSIRESISLP
jgi:hypothetical protein